MLCAAGADREILLVDPGGQVPYYDRALAAALARQGRRVRLATSPPAGYRLGPPEGADLELAFAAWLAGGGGWARLARGRPIARRLLRLAGYPFELTALLRRAARAHRPVLHVQWSLSPTLDALAFRLARRAGFPVVYTAHNVLPHERLTGQAGRYRRLYRGASRLIVHAESSRAALRGLLGEPSAAIDVIPLPADVVERPPDPLAARAALGLPTARPLALFFGHIRGYKGLDLLLAAWPGVLARLPEAGLLVAGAVPPGTGGEGGWRRRVAAAGPDAGIDFRPGLVPAAERDLWFAAADVVVLPYRAVDASAVLATARGHGRPVVATAVGGLPEALAAGGGLLVPRGDPGALGEAIAALLGDAPRRAALGEAARRAALAWTWDDAARATLVTYGRADDGPR